MRYYIYSENKPTEVSEPVYHEWELSDKYNYSFEDYSLTLNNKTFLIQIAYFGVFGDDEIAKPFVLSYSSYATINSQLTEESSIEFYETYEAVDFRRNELIRQIKKQLWPRYA